MIKEVKLSRRGIVMELGLKSNCAKRTVPLTLYGEISCTRKMSQGEIEGEYKRETGNVIVKTFSGVNPVHVPGVLVEDHRPFSWGKSPAEAVHNAVVLEEVAKMAFNTCLLSPGKAEPVSKYLLDKHFLRKHGKNAYYGQT